MFTLRNLMSIMCLPVLLFAACQDLAPEPDVATKAGNLLLKPSFRQTTHAAFRLEQESAQGLTLRAVDGSLSVGAKPTHGRLFSTLDCKECGWTNELGRPRLPAVRRLVEAPAGADISVRLVAKDRRTTQLTELGARHMIFPVQRPVVKEPGAMERTPFEMDEELYATDAFYPAESYNVSGPFVIRGHWLYMLAYYPLRYNPFRSEIQTTPGAELEVSFLGGSPDLEAQLRYSPAYENWFRLNVVNYRPTGHKRDISTAKWAEGFLVIVGDAYASEPEMLDYVETRRAEGHFVTMVPMSTVGSSANNVRNYIISQYQSWTDPALTYVVLFGDVADVPVHTGSGGGSSQVTDLYYASIDPEPYTDDLLAPDLFVSRVSINDKAELTTYLDRAHNYLYANFPTDTSWMKKIAWLAACDFADVGEGTHNYVIDTYTTALGFTGIIPNNPQPGGDKLYCRPGDATTTKITTALNDGRLAVNMSGHGSETSWGDPSYSDLSGINPPDAAPFVISDACLTGSFGRSGGDCWGEKWLAHSSGAILYWGASNSSYWDEDDIMERRMWDGVFADNITRFSDLIRNAKLELLAVYGDIGRMDYYFEMYNLLGDGTIDFFTDVAFDGTVMYPTEIPVGIDTLDFTVANGATALPGALVCVRGGVVQQVGYTDAAGAVTIIMNPPPDTVGDLQVTVTAHNMRRHEGTIQVIPADGPYLVHQSHELTSDGATPLTPNPGRHVIMPITMHNIGTDAATGISATLYSDSPAATITMNQPVFADIAPDANGRSTTHAEFDIHPDAADGTLIDFRVEWAAAKAAGTSRFNVTVVRPRLVYVSHTVDDSLGNCDQDGIADATEPTVFEVTVENQGSGDASLASMALSAPDCNVSGSGSLGSVPSGTQATATFTVVALPGIACPAVDVPFTISVSADELPTADQSSFTEVLNADMTIDSYSDDMEGVEPNGWSHQATVGSDDWGYVTDSYHSATHAWFAADVATLKDASLMTPELTIGETAELVFWQRYEFENTFDGGVIEISTDSGQSFSDLGNYITESPYTTILSTGFSNPIGGRSAWSGNRDWHQVTVDLSSFGPGDVIIKFRMGCDSSVDGVGWWIDDLLMDAETVVCQQQPCDGPNDPPVADAGPDQEVTEDDLVTLDGSGSSDPDGHALNYLWSQSAGPSVTLSDPEIVNPTFTPPDVSEPTVLTFTLVVSDWQYDSDPDSVDITVNPVNHAPLADAGADQDADSGDTVVLDGSASHDPDGDSITYSWAQTGGPAAALSDPLVADPSFVAPEVEGWVDLVFELTVSDGTLTGSDAVTIQVWGGCDDGNACTEDRWRLGQCEHNPIDCSDGNDCTVDDCDEAAGCLNPPLDCVPCGVDGMCLGGECQTGAQGDEECTDNNACTVNDACVDGACVGDAVVCQAQDDCHLAGECDPATGECSNPPAADGTACDDDDACTQVDACLAGECVGSDAIECPVENDCQLSGTCDPATGACAYTSQEDGTSCDDGDACTQVDTCQSGACVGSDPVVCEMLDECHLAGDCDPATGACSNPAVPDGTACTGGECQDGECKKSDDGCGCSHSPSRAPLSGLLLGLFLALWLPRSRRKH